MNKEPIFKFNEELGSATCTIFYKNYEFTGLACCHSDDRDMMSEKVGYEIAFSRALVKYLQFIKNCEIKPKYEMCHHLYCSLKSKKNFNPKDPSFILIKNHMENLLLDMETIKTEVNKERQRIHQYILDKETLYQKLRRLTKGEKINNPTLRKKQMQNYINKKYQNK